MFSSFLADRPVLKDRLFACAVFSGIAVGGVSGVNMVITGGFDFATPGREIRQAAPSSHVEVVSPNLFERGRVIPIVSTEPLFAGEAAPASETLDGGSGDTTAPPGHYPAADDNSGDALYQQLAARYEDPAAHAARNVQPAVATIATDDEKAASAAPDDSEARFDALEAQVQQAIPASAMPARPPA